MRSGAHVDPLTRHSPAFRSTGRIIKESNKLSKVRYSFAPLNTQSDSYTVLEFPNCKIDLSVEAQTTSRTPFVFVFSSIKHVWSAGILDEDVFGQPVGTNVVLHSSLGCILI